LKAKINLHQFKCNKIGSVGESPQPPLRVREGPNHSSFMTKTGRLVSLELRLKLKRRQVFEDLLLLPIKRLVELLS